MKNVFKSLFLACTLAAFNFGCTGEDGALGPAGANGTNGTNGTNGKDGNANVVYTDWKEIDWSGGFFKYNSNKNASLTVKNTAEPLFTQEAMDKAVVYTYYKTNDLVEDASSTGDYVLADRIGTSGNYFFKRPGITTSKYEDYSQMLVSTFKMGLNYFQPTMYFATQTYDYTISNYIADPLFTTKVAADFRAYAKPVTYRHVIIYGSTKAARLNQHVDMNDYQAVKAFYKITD